jgi:hypothetical protein
LRKNARNFAQFLKIRDYFFWGAIFGHISALFPKNTQKSPVLSRFRQEVSRIQKSTASKTTIFGTFETKSMAVS